MRYTGKLKPVNKAWIGLIFIGNGIIALTAGMYGFIGPYVSLLGFALLCIVFLNVVFCIRTWNFSYLITSFHYLIITLILLAFASGYREVLPVLTVCVLFTLFFLFYAGLSRKLKWRKREILELAAMPVDEITDGFTHRPHPTGKAEYGKDELTEFAGYILGHLIAIPCVEAGRIVFLITDRVVSYILNIRSDYSNETYVSFDYEGNVSVKISKQDYLQYKDQLSFDKLCVSLGALFEEFLELHRNGDSTRIIDRMNELKMNPFTGGIIGF